MGAPRVRTFNHLTDKQRLCQQGENQRFCCGTNPL